MLSIEGEACGFSKAYVVLSSLENVIVCLLVDLRILRESEMWQISFDHREGDVGAIRHGIGKTDVGIMLSWGLDFQMVKDVWRAESVITFTFCTF